MLNEKTFRKIYNDYLASGLTVKDFCSTQSILPRKFYYWQNKLKEQLAPKQGFVPILLKPQDTVEHFPAAQQNQFQPSSNPAHWAAHEPQTCEIFFPNGVCVKLTGSTDPEFIQSLILLNAPDHV